MEKLEFGDIIWGKTDFDGVEDKHNNRPFVILGYDKEEDSYKALNCTSQYNKYKPFRTNYIIKKDELDKITTVTIKRIDTLKKDQISSLASKLTYSEKQEIRKRLPLSDNYSELKQNILENIEKYPIFFKPGDIVRTEKNKSYIIIDNSNNNITAYILQRQNKNENEYLPINIDNCRYKYIRKIPSNINTKIKYEGSFRNEEFLEILKTIRHTKTLEKSNKHVKNNEEKHELTPGNILKLHIDGRSTQVKVLSINKESLLCIEYRLHGKKEYEGRMHVIQLPLEEHTIKKQEDIIKPRTRRK